MSFGDLANDKVVVVRQNGDRYENVAASVQRGKIFFEADQAVIDVGDQIHQTTPAGVTVFIVEDPCYYNALGGIPAHYQSRVRRQDAPATTSPMGFGNVTMGDNSRVNINTTDNSTNIINKDSVFNELREKMIAELTDEDVKSQALALVDELESADSEEGTTGAISKLMNLGAQVVTIASPFLPAIMKLVTG
ncbi:hypothetical protein PSDVSF_03650 [Pseudodesulfovibrio sediminis]|uniref:Uncharacterized protein n=2 Tax=Pseudodesulfovibrio sediminis TaxID=2810563 RepID=A0ABM7P2R6_9BACT|nr:hypothetical protein PSDVSF_03650 [Pseudodesulfovibrio sediminis]